MLAAGAGKNDCVTADRVLLWDFDGTLAQRPGHWSGAILEALDASLPGHGYQRAKIAAAMATGYPWHQPDIAHPHLSDPQAWWEHMSAVLASALTGLGLGQSDARGATALVRDRYTDPAGWQLYPDTIPALTELSRRGWRHAVLSNHVPELPAIIESLGLAPFLAVIINSASTGYEKPHPQAFRLALAAAGYPEEVWMIGDNPVADIAGARAAGIRAILVRSPNPGLPDYAPDLTTVADLIAAGPRDQIQPGIAPARDTPAGP